MILSGCGSDKGTGPKSEEITGTWSATKDEYVSKSSAITVDLIAQGGTATLELRSDQTFEFTCTPAGKAPEVTTGTWSVGTDVFRATPTGMSWSWEWDFSLASGVLTLAGATAEYDCNNDGTPEDATWNLTFVR
jgi:hypothetical protein